MANKVQRSNAPAAARTETQRAHALWTRSRRFSLHAAIAILAVGAFASLAIYLALPGDRHPTPPRPASTVADNENACLLTDANQPQAPAVFADLQQAAATLGGVNVRQTALPPQVNDAAPELAGLIQQHCAVVYTIGPRSTTAAKAAAANTQPAPVVFIAITDDAISGTHLTVLPAAHLTPGQITTTLTTALR